MIKLGFSGAKGRMNQENLKYLDELNNKNLVVSALYEPFKKIELNDFYINSKNEKVKYSNDIEVLKNCDIIIDFSHFSITEKVINFAVDNNKKIVIGTTNLNENILKKINEVSNEIAVFLSFNMSFGINFLLNIFDKFLYSLKDWDIEIVEVHHINKKDAPSGTAKMFMKKIEEIRKNIEFIFDRSTISESKKENTIGVSSIRSGGVKGEHRIIFGNMYELIELKHTALDRKVFSIGTFKAVEFIKDKNHGLFTFKDIFEN